MKAKIFSLSLLSMMAAPKTGAMEEIVDGTFGTVGQTLRSFYEVVKKPSILEDTQVHAALADTLVPDLMRQKAEAENQAATALSFLSLLEFQTGEGSPLPLEQQVQNYIRAKARQEANLREATQGWDGTKRQLAEAARAEEAKNTELSALKEKLAEMSQERDEAKRQLAEAARMEEERKAELSSIGKKVLETAQGWDETKQELAEAARAEEAKNTELSALKDKLAEMSQERDEAKRQLAEAEEAQATQQVAYITLEKKLAEVVQERQETKGQLAQMLQEHVNINDGTTSGDEEVGANLVQVIDLTTVPTLAQENQTNFFAYLESLKDGQNDLMIESTKGVYALVPQPAHRAKMLKAVEYLKTAQITANQVTEQLTKVHQAEMEAVRMAMEKKLAEIIQERANTNEVALPGIGGEFAANTTQAIAIDLTNLRVLTPTQVGGNQSIFFGYLDSLKDGQNDWIIEGGKNAYTACPIRAPMAKMNQAIQYIQIAQTTANQMIEQLMKKSVEGSQGRQETK